MALHYIFGHKLTKRQHRLTYIRTYLVPSICRTGPDIRSMNNARTRTPASRFYNKTPTSHNDSMGATYIGNKRISPIFLLVSRTDPRCARFPEYSILQYITVIYHRRVLSIPYSACDPTLRDRLDCPVSKQRLWVCDPFLAVIAVIVTT